MLILTIQNFTWVLLEISIPPAYSLPSHSNTHSIEIHGIDKYTPLTNKHYTKPESVIFFVNIPYIRIDDSIFRTTLFLDFIFFSYIKWCGNGNTNTSLLNLQVLEY